MVMVIIWCFFLALEASQLACWTSCTLYGLHCSVSLFSWSWVLASVPDAEFTPHHGPPVLTRLQGFFRAFDAQSYMYSVKVARKLLADAAPSIWSAETLMRKLSDHPSRRLLQPLLFQVQCWTGDFSPQLLVTLFIARQWTFCSRIFSNSSQISISILSRDASFPSDILPSHYLA